LPSRNKLKVSYSVSKRLSVVFQVCHNAVLQLCQKHSCKVATKLECFAVKLGRMCLCECVAECCCVLQCDAVAKLQHLGLSCSRTRIVLLSLLTERVLANAFQCVAECLSKVLQCVAQYLASGLQNRNNFPHKAINVLTSIHTNYKALPHHTATRQQTTTLCNTLKNNSTSGVCPHLVIFSPFCPILPLHTGVSRTVPSDGGSQK